MEEEKSPFCGYLIPLHSCVIPSFIMLESHTRVPGETAVSASGLAASDTAMNRQIFGRLVDHPRFSCPSLH